MVGWGFKAERFRAHVRALAAVDPRLVFLLEEGGGAYEYVAVGEPPENAAAALAGEQKTLQAFAAEPLGNAGALLEKRRARDPHGMHRPYTGPLADAIVW